MDKRKIWFMALTLTVASVAVGAFIGQMVSTKSDFYKYLGIFSDVLTIVRRDYVDAVETNHLMEGANSGLLSGLDPQSSYMTKDALTEYRNLQKDAEAEPGIEFLKVYGYPIVVSVYKDSPADRAGVEPGDQVLAISGKSTRDLSLIQCRRMISGKEGTEVSLSVINAKSFSKMDLNLKREKIVHPGYDAALQNNRIAHLRIYDLGRLDVQVLADSLRSIERRSTALLIDLRDSASGSYGKASSVASLFLEKGPVFFSEKRGIEANPVQFSSGGFIWRKPVYLLINGWTAGPSEGLALVLKERISAKVIGEKSYGMAHEPELITLDDGSGVILSTMKYITSEGTSWSKSGITPSYEIRSEASEIGKQEEEQLQKSLEFIDQDVMAKVKKAA